MKQVGDALKGISLPKGTGATSTGRKDKAVSTGECPICGGAGYLRADVPLGDPFFGRLVMCDCKMSELEEQHLQELQALSKLEPFKHKTFTNFDSTIKGVETACREARRYAREPRGWLLLMGGYGCGKTHLAAAIANEAINHRFGVLFTVVPDLLDHLRSTFSPNSDKQYDELFEGIRTTPLLILDDLGTESGTPWAREKLYQIFNHRYNHELPTVITTNRDLRDIDERITSRMSDRAFCKIIYIEANDYRLKEKGSRRYR